MSRATFIATGLIAYVKIPCTLEEPIFKRPTLLRDYLRVQKQILKGRVTLQPVIVLIEKRLFEKHGWSLELDDAETAYIAHADSLYAFQFDDSAIHPNALIDAIHAARTLQLESAIDNLNLIPFPNARIPGNRTVMVRNVVKENFRVEPPALIRSAFEDLFSHRSGTGGQEDDALWPLVEIILGDERLLYALLFLRASYKELQFRGDDISVVLETRGKAPVFVHEAVHSENAIHNAYKVIEALWGGTLPKSRNDIERGLRKRNMDPQEAVGYRGKGADRLPIVEKIQLLQAARDERAAHGRIGANRKATYYEIMDFQGLAHVFIVKYLVDKYPALLARQSVDLAA